MSDDNEIHPTVIIEGDVRLGKRNRILPYTILIGPLIIGDDNIIGPHATIGTPGQDTRNPRHDASAAPIEIGHRNIIREYSSIHKPCYRDITRIGNDTYLMHGAHVSHDVILEDRVVLTMSVAIGGIARILEGANLAIGCSIHQYSVVGAYSIVGMGAALTKNLKPFSRYVPGKALSINYYAIEKFGFGAHIDEIADYVLYGARPISPRVHALVAQYDRLHAESRRDQY